jgi:NAD(P)-dependent dehydrogenase (short-subunit alcohol dehydrogenase family)
MHQPTPWPAGTVFQQATRKQGGTGTVSIRDLSGTTAIVTGASRGFGRATTVSLAAQGAHVVGVARSERLLGELKEQLGEAFTAEVADVSHPSLASRLLTRYRPQTLVLNAGATPTVGTLREQTWETFSANWNLDVFHVFNFTREALMTPLDAGSVVVSLSSAAVLRGSPLSGGYAGAKSTIKLISAYARTESERTDSNIRFVAVLPQLTPATELGRTYTEAYATQAGLSETAFLERIGGPYRADQAAKSISELVADDAYAAPAYLLTPAGLQALEAATL